MVGEPLVFRITLTLPPTSRRPRNPGWQLRCPLRPRVVLVRLRNPCLGGSTASSHPYRLLHAGSQVAFTRQASISRNGPRPGARRTC